jgi:hypothetical protein
MKITLKYLGSMTLSEFADKNNLKMSVTVTNVGYHAGFDLIEVKESAGVLASVFGSGETLQEALKDYAKKITHKTLTYNAFSAEKRFDIMTPVLVHE